tara:strand:- start:16084 stop:17397 length:1314 start_codon:yes stop_codon:yes gene_type:complete
MDWLKEYKNRNNKTFNQIFSMIEENLDKNFLIKEEVDSSGKKFLMVLPKMSPSEAWGNPNNLERQQVNDIFRVVTGGANIAERIDFINKFLDPESAERRTSPRVIINTMMIVEALRASMNHFTESSAGFVFEAFMAALMGGSQQTSKVQGTLPIEDFVAFDQFGEGVPVSLKLLSPKTGIKGSFTNLVDFLFVRGADSIKYLIAYKTYEGGNKDTGDKGSVGKLEIYDFDITKANLVDFVMGGTGTTKGLLDPVSPRKAKKVIASGDEVAIAKMFMSTKGYTSKGLLKTPLGDSVSNLAAKADGDGEIEVKENFHLRENKMLLTEASDSQWEVSATMMNSLGKKINLTKHGDGLDFTEARMNQLADIYAKKLGDSILQLLESTQELTNNIGAYFSQEDRSKAMAAGDGAKAAAKSIEENLASQLSKDDSQTSFDFSE